MSRVETRRIVVVPAITAVAYAAGDALGDKLTFPDAAGIGGRGGLVLRATLVCKAALAQNVDLLLFDSDFTASADNAAFQMAAADMGKFIGSLTFYSGTVNAGTYFVAEGWNSPGIPYQARGGTALYGQLVIRDIQTFAVGDISVGLSVRPDLG